LNNKIIQLFLIGNIVFGQEYPPPTDLVTIPTAGTLMRGSYSLNMRILDSGGMIAGLRAGLTDRFQFGLSFGSPNLIGDDSLRWYPRPEANIKYLLLDETESIPGVSLGINTQGFGNYNSADTLQRYDTKAYGAYLSASKNWQTPLGNTGLHSGINYNFTETADKDTDLNLFCGMDLELNPEFSLLLEYSAALNENNMTARTIAINSGGYLNAAIRWTFVDHFHLEMHFNNLLFDKDIVNYFKREIKITYIEYF
tara:strand:- start:1778 stop:2539 length:762 start_codon:yes stop_codon:yes gene_type:complete